MSYRLPQFLGADVFFVADASQQNVVGFQNAPRIEEQGLVGLSLKALVLTRRRDSRIQFLVNFFQYTAEFFFISAEQDQAIGFMF